MVAGSRVLPGAQVRFRLVSWVRSVRPPGWRLALSQPGLLAHLAVVAVLYALGAAELPQWFPVATASVWLMLGGFFLRVRYLLVYFVIVAAAVTYGVMQRDQGAPTPGVIVALVATGLLVLGYARSRESIGIQGAVGETMLVDLRDRLMAQGRIPALEPGWRVESVLRPAYGDAFSGDFLVAGRSADRRWIELVLVDVSGKGQAAGSRALMLSGAFGGLLGAAPRDRFLQAANRYLLRQEWPEGFATAVHVALDQETGAFELRSAGHPPAVQYHHGTGRWQVVDEGQGPLLGVLADPAFDVYPGVLRPGDALLLYTDGLVEAPGRGIEVGIDRLMGAAERVVTSGSGGGARIIERVGAGENDDRALVLVQRLIGS